MLKHHAPQKLTEVFFKSLDHLPADTVTVKFARQFLKAQAARLNVPQWEAYKTPAFYARVMKEQIRLFYNSQADVFSFLDRMFDLIGDQFRRAFNDGLRSVGFDPKDMTPDMALELETRTQAEFAHLLDFAQELEEARNRGTSVEPFYYRVPLWAARYSELVDLGALLGGTRNDLYEWQLGQTEQHCETCRTLHGIVATRSDWIASGLRPQSAPNPRLECGGWRCDCSLVPVSGKEPTPGGIPKV